MTLGSLFDGSGGFPLAGVMNGIVPVWASEIEPFPIRVTTKRFPAMRHYGDIREMHGDKIEPVDIITFGSPCQDMSVAGKRAGIHEGKRSSLFFEAARIIREMREATNGKYPTFAVWENVYGAFSSNKGEDFRSVVETLCQIADESVSIPRPDKWQSCGFVRGGGIHWRGEYSTHNTGECPSADVACTLWRILEENVPERYYLSAKACAGIIRRAEIRGKKLSKILLDALTEAVALGV